jgi:protein involved in sex pheromone biosynthesis
MKKLILFATLAATALLAGCANDAQVASHNLSQKADNFGIVRRIVFYNGITDGYMLTIVGLCSQEQTDKKLAVTCKLKSGEYVKHFLGLSDNTTYFSEQLAGADVSVDHYKITFKPSTIIPAIDVR